MLLVNYHNSISTSHHHASHFRSHYYCALYIYNILGSYHSHNLVPPFKQTPIHPRLMFYLHRQISLQQWFLLCKFCQNPYFSGMQKHPLASSNSNNLWDFESTISPTSTTLNRNKQLNLRFPLPCLSSNLEYPTISLCKSYITLESWPFKKWNTFLPIL